MRRKGLILFFKMVLITNISVCKGQAIPEEVTYEEDTAITARELQALAKFKKAVIPQIPKNSYIHNYIKDDLYFIKWLRATSFDVESAENRFLEHLKWRETQRMDTIAEEEFPGFERDYPWLLNITDKRHRPSAEVWFGDWNIREASLAGKGPQLARWATRGFEMLQRQVYEARSKGVKVSQAVFLGDLEGFNLVQQACPSCLSIIGAMTLAYVRQYQGLLESIVVFNMPPTFDIVLRFTKPIFGPQNSQLIKTFTGKDKWGPYLDGRYEKSQLTPKYGGNRVRDTKYR